MSDSAIAFPVLLKGFIDEVHCGGIEIYNEFSLQHELGIFLRGALPASWKVQFERNVSFFFDGKENFEKKEIDIVVFEEAAANTLHYAIELKYPRNGQYPEQMFSFCKDIAFTEQLKEAGFKQGYVLILAEDPLFYQGNYNDNDVYRYFRGGKVLNGIVTKPTGKKDAQVSIKGRYEIHWQSIAGDLRYTLIEAE